MNNTTKPHLNFIDYLKAIAIFMVILHHVLYQYNETVAGLTETGNLVLLLCYFTHVPLFFVIAGFLSRPQAVGAYYRKRVTQLMIPFFFFSILKLIFTILAEREFAFGKIGGMVSQLFLVGTQYWFVYAMLGVSLVAPLLWKCAESMGRFLLPIGGVVLLLCRKWLNGKR